MNRIALSVLLLLLSPAAMAELLNAPPGPFEVVVEKDMMVPMRDGIRLATDMYFPKSGRERLPAITIRTPYHKGKDYAVDEARYYAAHGYRVLVQDVRGKWKSEGKYVVSGADRKDGYDFIDWIVKQAWSDGQTGSTGCSYRGENQIMLAAEKHPAHKAMIARAAGGSVGKAGGYYSYFGAYQGGVFDLAGGYDWFTAYGTKNRTDGQFQPGDVEKVLQSLPLIDLLEQQGAGPTDWKAFASTPLSGSWWDSLGYITDQDTFDVPTLHVNSWYDYGVSQSLFLFNRFQQQAVSDEARKGQYAIISPVGHCDSEKATLNTMVGQVNVGDARLPYWETYLKWFDYWLKGEKNSVTEMPRVQYYLIGQGEWKSANSWPPSNSVNQTYYLHSGGSANTSSGDGKLAVAAPGAQKPDLFTYDPGSPVPSRGGTVCCTGNPEDQSGIFDQSDIELRPDVLVYTGELLEKGLTLAGPVRAMLWVSSSARDTDFALKLVDVWPDGRAYNIQDGILRARYREGFDKQVMMAPGEIYRLEISLNDTAYSLKPGHRLRLEVSSSNFPRSARNLNTGGNNYDETEWVVAKNTIHHSAEYPSHLILPVIEHHR